MTNPMEPSGGFLSDVTASQAIWFWRLEDRSGAEVGAPSVAPNGAPRFPSQSDAESWVGEVWRELLEDGVDAVTLFEADRMVYGPMSLHA